MFFLKVYFVWKVLLIVIMEVVGGIIFFIWDVFDSIIRGVYMFMIF